MKDPIVEEVRRHRMTHTRKFKGDLAEICADLRAIEKASGLEVVSLTPKKLKARKTKSSHPGPKSETCGKR